MASHPQIDALEAAFRSFAAAVIDTHPDREALWCELRRQYAGTQAGLRADYASAETAQAYRAIFAGLGLDLGELQAGEPYCEPPASAER